MTDDFWDGSAEFTSPGSVTDEDVARVERLLGYTLPKAYVALLRTKNGGVPKRKAFPTATPTSWSPNHVAISGICGLGGKWGIDSDELGSRFMIAEWGYPPIGIVFGQCPSAGHDAILLDYSACGATGEPAVVHVDLEARGGPKLTPLAPDFESFLSGLVDARTFTDR